MTTRRIVLLGFMGCGKTTAGSELARQLECGFVDLDSFIRDREGRAPAQIIVEDGETAFRELETLVLRDVLQDHRMHVIALGGGTWTIPANRTLVALYDCLTIWIDTPFEICWERIVSAPSQRPLAPNRETAKERFGQRRDIYALAERHVPVQADDTVGQVVEQIFRET